MVTLLLSLLAALVVHEYAHAWTARTLGDPSPDAAGRVTLDPLAHVDAVGTVALPLATALAFGVPLGYGRALAFDRRRLTPGGQVVVLMAGPAANLALAALAWAAGAEVLLRVNLAFGLFNLVPVPPLDGGQAVQVVWRARR